MVTCTAHLLIQQRVDNEIILSGKQQIALTTGTYLIKAGLRSINCRVKVSYDKNSYVNKLKLEAKIAAALLLPTQNTVNIRIENGEIELVPFLGVFISESKAARLLSGGWDSVYWRFQQWTQAIHGFVYFFTISGINWEQRKVQGYYFNREKVWVSKEFPLPYVIYDRCFGKDGREASYLLRQLVEANELPITVYNSVVKIAKYETYEHLSKYPHLRDALPEYAWYEQTKLLSLMKEHQNVYLKPDRLYKGQGVIRVSQAETGYSIEYRSEQGNEVLNLPDEDSFIAKLEELIAGEQNYLMQVGIDLATFFGNRFDVRVMLQKKTPDCWSVTGINARIAATDSVITSPRSGGNVLRVSEVLNWLFPHDAEKIIENIIQLTCSMGEALEEKFGFLGELGVDLGVDKNGNVKLIEVNGKPLKVSFTRMRDRGLNKEINYAPMLLGFALAGCEVTQKVKYTLPQDNDLIQLKLMPYAPGWPKKVVLLNSLQLKRFGYRLGQLITLRVGATKCSAEIWQQEKDLSEDKIYLSTQLYNELPDYIPKTIALTAYSSQEIVLGPLMGMTVSKDTVEYLDTDVELKKSALLAAAKGIIFYLFTLEDIKWEEELVNAYIYQQKQQKWQQRWLPFPHVLYDLATYPYDPATRAVAKEANKTLRRDPHLQVINARRYFGKWQTYEALSFFRDVRVYVPDTEPLSLSMLEWFLENYPSSYVKSNYGSFGEGVLRVESTQEGLICKAGGELTTSWAFSSTEELYNFIIEKLGTNSIIQQGLPLAQIDGCPFDMRVLMAKDGSSRWVVSSISYRIAQPGAVVTNAMSGAHEIIVGAGEQLPYEGVSWLQITEFAQKIALALETSFGWHGEIGLDIGIDEENRLWLIEANSKPNTTGYLQLTSEAVCDLVYGLPLDYSKFLARRMYALQCF
ncbi:MAG: YheC/YheD family protein [Firmicutes bacterium]|nr:YheC/YheD family protein [Bacillota bacterium]